MEISQLNVLYEDNHLLIVLKPARMLVQRDNTGDPSLLDIAKHWVKEKYQKPGNVYLGLVHRLDRPAEGVMVFAKTSKAASRLSHQFRERTVEKAYLAVVQGHVEPESGRLEHSIRKRPGNRRVHISQNPLQDGKHAALTYNVCEEVDDLSLVHVQLHTGRHHQIRAQFAYIGHPVVGDYKYTSRIPLPDKRIALLAHSISFTHPTVKTPMTIESPFPNYWPWTLFTYEE